MSFSSHKSLFVAGLMFAIGTALSTGVVRSEAVATGSVEPQPLDSVIRALASYKSFRLTTAQLDSIILPYCKKTRSMAQKPMVLSEYACPTDSGIMAIQVDSREEMGPPLPNYVMSIVVDFPRDKFSAIKASLEKPLGRAKRKTKDFFEWRYVKDEVLNMNGNPVINLSRTDSDNAASLHVVLEQGP